MICLQFKILSGCPRGVMVKAMVCKIVPREFELQSRYYVHFRTNTLGKGINPRYLPIYGLNSTTTVLLGEWLWHLITHEGWYTIKKINQTNQNPSEFFTSVLADGLSLRFEWQQVSSSVFSIQADLNNVVVGIVPTRLLNSKSSSPCTRLLVTV